MKTIVIWDQCGEDAIQFFIVNGDYSHLDRVYLNSDATEEQDRELNEVMGYGEDGRPKVKMLTKFPEILEPHVVIVCGFFP